MMYKTSEVAKKLGITKDTLFYYEKEGLLPEIARDKLMRREYSDSDIEWIYLVRCLRDTDMSIQMMKQYIALLKKDGTNTIHERREILVQHKTFMEDKLKSYQYFLSLIHKKIAFYDESMSQDGQLQCVDYATEWEHFRTILKEGKHE